MKDTTLALLCDPETQMPLKLQTGPNRQRSLIGPTGTYYPVVEGMPNFLYNRQLSGTNKRYQALYNRLSPFYNFVTRSAIMLMNASEEEVRREYLCELEIKKGDLVLEVSVGTGTNLRLLPPDAHYYGLDISSGQLAQCKKNIKKSGQEAELFLGQAECLPFRDNSFDIVFHMGGINFFTDAELAVQEMYRVAKPGTKIVIVDETDRFTKKLAKIPIVQAFFKSDSGVVIPAPSLPSNAEEVCVKELFNGRLWYLGFRKPKAKLNPTAAAAGLLKQRALHHSL